MLTLSANAVVFDLDGTLTEPLLDFGLMRQEMGIAPGRPILEAMGEMDTAALAEAWRVLDRHEQAAAENAQPAAGAMELLERLERERMPWGILTRNSRRSMETVLERFGLKPGAAVSRDDAPAKPDVRSMWEVLGRLGLGAEKATGVWMVGDGHHDLEVALAAGMGAVLVGDERAARGVRFTHRVHGLAGLVFERAGNVSE